MTPALARTASAVLGLLLLAEPSAGQAAALLSVRAVEYKSDDIEIPAAGSSATTHIS